MSKYNRRLISLYFITLDLKTFNKDSVLARKRTLILHLGHPADRKKVSYEKDRSQLRVSIGWIGNCHPFYISFKEGGNHLVTFHTGTMDTTIYHKKWSLEFWWNSEHIAKKYGVYHDNTDECGMPKGGGPEDWWAYEGRLGNHTYL